MSKISMSSLAKSPQPAPVKASAESVNLLTSEPVTKKRPPPSALLCQVAVRMTKTERRKLRRLALDLDMSVQDLVIAALDEYREKKGLR